MSDCIDAKLIPYGSVIVYFLSIKSRDINATKDSSLLSKNTSTNVSNSSQCKLYPWTSKLIVKIILNTNNKNASKSSLNTHSIYNITHQKIKHMEHNKTTNNLSNFNINEKI